MEDKEILEFIQEVSRPLSYRLYWQIPRQNNTTYQVDVDAMELAFEMSISDSLNADNSYINQLPEIKERLDTVLSKLQRRRYRYEKVANELKDNLPILSIRQKYTREQQRNADNLSHFRNIIGQFRLVLEPNIKKGIKYIEKKLKEQEEKETIVVVGVEKTEKATQQKKDTQKRDKAPHYNLVNYERIHLKEIYKRIAHHLMANRRRKKETVTDFIFLGSKITTDGDCSHEIIRHLVLGRKAMTNLDSIFKSRDITLPTKVCLVKAVVIPVVMYGCESWTVKKVQR